MEVDWRSLDTFRSCSVGGCQWRIQSPWPTKCWTHGGPRFPQYVEGDDGSILTSKFLPGEEPDEPWEP